MVSTIRKTAIFLMFALCAVMLASCANIFGENPPAAEPVVTLTPEPDNPTIAPPTKAPELTQEEVVADYFEKRQLCISFYLPFFGNTQIGQEKCSADDGLIFILSYYDFYNKYTEYKHDIDDDTFYYEIPAQLIQSLLDKTFVNPPLITDSTFYIKGSDIVKYQHTDSVFESAIGMLTINSVSKESDRFLIFFAGDNISSVLTVYQRENGYIIESYLPND